MAELYGRWIRELRRAERRASLDVLGDVLAEARADLAVSDPQERPSGPPERPVGPPVWGELLHDEVATLRTGTPVVRARTPGADGRRPPPEGGEDPADPARLLHAGSLLRRRLLAGDDPRILLHESEALLAVVDGVRGAEGFVACLASFAALAASLEGDEAALAINLDRSLRAREAAPPGFAAEGSDLMRSWAISVTSSMPRIAGGTAEQQAEVSVTPLFRRLSDEARGRGLRPGFGAVSPLTPHEARLLHFVSAGLTVREIAALLHVSPRTVESQLDRVRSASGTTTLCAALRLHAEAVGAQTGGAVVSLTERERQVAGYVALGWRNSAIAESVGVSVKTVEKHLSTALAKTGSRNRAALAAWWAGSEP
ncbi:MULTISPECIES: helix-turn-helix transcriptional regulator [Arthrobacter]|uniref:Helix-turn-helix transcriptional regulator n=2 Tax=Arthrobacter TaxID=1663 RepID=A0ABU9KMC7_9MICC|nr:helix-turn-helix transcriptional regulator [Arthrobacter sp. YJM1]MDP5228009.1 helix-turn-helix transcriptional regulator [Arthrobacter sp. YJM1]